MRHATPLALAAAVLAVLTLMSTTLYTTSEIEQGLIIRLGAPVSVVTTPGMHFKLPFVDSVVPYETRLLTLEPPTEQVILGDQKRIEVQTYTRFRISDPLRFYQSLRSLDQAATQLTQIVSSLLRRELGQVMLRSLLSEERTKIVDRIQKEVDERARPLGIEVEDVRFHRADLPRETSQAIYDRMKSERQREAKELRAQGFEWAQKIQSEADRERTVIVSTAQRQAKITRGEADADANEILAQAFARDARFYRLYRSLQTYRQALADSGATLVLSPDSEFLRFFKSGPGAAALPKR
jgi:modulator of FtsH protease HflC